jgi:hypothetical protein
MALELEWLAGHPELCSDFVHLDQIVETTSILFLKGHKLFSNRTSQMVVSGYQLSLTTDDSAGLPLRNERLINLQWP